MREAFAYGKCFGSLTAFPLALYIMPTAGPTAFANGKNLAAACGNLALAEGKN